MLVRTILKSSKLLGTKRMTLKGGGGGGGGGGLALDLTVVNFNL